MSKGFAAIGLHRPKDIANIGGALRAAHCYSASMVAISGNRVSGDAIRHATNTTQAQRHMPVLRGNLEDLIPFGAVPIAVDLVEGATQIQDFCHPQSAFYIFGPEDGTLGKPVLDWCPYKIMVPTAFCMNLAATVNVVLYDRLAKQLTAGRREAFFHRSA